MIKLTDALEQLDQVLNQLAPDLKNRLQLGLTSTEIQQQTASFDWDLPQDAATLYQWHNGLSGQPGNLNLLEKLVRLKGKWHGELTGRENELRLSEGQRLTVAKFLPLEYALAGHRHLRLGRCALNLLPIFLLIDDTTTRYGLMRLDESAIVYVANGTNLPPIKVTEVFLSQQAQFSLAELILLLSTGVQQAIQPLTDRSVADYGFDSTQFNINGVIQR